MAPPSDPRVCQRTSSTAGAGASRRRPMGKKVEKKNFDKKTALVCVYDKLCLCLFMDKVLCLTKKTINTKLFSDIVLQQSTPCFCFSLHDDLFIKLEKKLLLETRKKLTLEFMFHLIGPNDPL